MPGKAKKKNAPRKKGKKSAPRPRRKGGAKPAQVSSAALDSFVSTGQAIGSYIAPGVGGIIGGAVGRAASSLYTKITGRGDYKVSANSLLFKAAPVPSFGPQCIRVTHREYLGDVFSTTLFNSTAYPLNPGQSMVFPWLASIASCFEQFHFNGLIFEYVSTSATALNSINTALGKVVMATDYDAIDVDFPDTRSMLAALYSNYGMPSANLIHAIECAPGTTPTELLYVRTGAVPAGADVRLYDLGNFTFATEGMQAASNIGGLWVSYDITFCKPVLGVNAGSIPTQVISLPGMSGGLFSGAVVVGPSQGFIPLTLVNGATAAMTLPSAKPGEIYNIQIWSRGGTISALPIVVGSDMTSLIVSPGYVIGTTTASGVITMVVSTIMQVSGPTPAILFTSGVWPNGTVGWLVISMLNSFTSGLSGVPFSPLPVDEKMICAPVPREPELVLSSLSVKAVGRAKKDPMEQLRLAIAKCEARQVEEWSHVPDSSVSVASGLPLRRK